MTKLKDLRILVTNGNDKIDFSTPVSVTKDGKNNIRIHINLMAG